MVKADLKTGMRVRMRNDSISLVVCDVLINGKKDILFADNDGEWMDGSSYKDNLMVEKHGNEEDRCFDIMEVYLINTNQDHFAGSFMKLNERNSIWKREEYTTKQKEIFKALKTLGYKYTAMDSNGGGQYLYAYIKKPVKGKCIWVNLDYNQIRITHLKEQFNFVKWKDVEPFEIPTLL